MGARCWVYILDLSDLAVQHGLPRCWEDDYVTDLSQSLVLPHPDSTGWPVPAKSIPDHDVMYPFSFGNHQAAQTSGPWYATWPQLPAPSSCAGSFACKGLLCVSIFMLLFQTIPYLCCTSYMTSEGRSPAAASASLHEPFTTIICFLSLQVVSLMLMILYCGDGGQALCEVASQVGRRHN